MQNKIAANTTAKNNNLQKKLKKIALINLKWIRIDNLIIMY